VYFGLAGGPDGASRNMLQCRRYHTEPGPDRRRGSRLPGATSRL